MPVAMISTSTSPAFGPFQIEFDDLQRLLGLEGDGGAGLQFNSPEEFDCLVYHKRRFRDNKANRNF
jgi:hypothetical protein